MRINHNVSSMITQTALGQADKSMSKSLEKLSTGLRINRASDDAAGLSVSEQLRTQVRGLGRAKSNAQDGIALLQIAEGAANEISDILQRQRELAIQSANDTLTSTERSYLNQEFEALTSEIDRITNATQYNGQTLLTGTAQAFGGTGSASSILHIGANDVAGTDNLTISISGISAQAIGLTGGSATVSVTSQAKAMAAITAVDAAISSVNQLRSDLGAYVNRLEHAINNIANQEYNTQDAESRVRDVDFATETTQFTRNQILTQSSTAMLAQANQVPQGALSLLG
jgi:flagellin